MDVSEGVQTNTGRKTFFERFLFRGVEEDSDETRGDSDETRGDSDESDDSDDSYSEQAEINYDCIVKSLLAGLVTTTAIFMVVIVASNRKTGSPTNSSSLNEMTSRSDDEVTHQFLIRDLSSDMYSQVLAVTEQTSTYIIDFSPSARKYYTAFLVVNFQEETETVLIISTPMNEFGTDVEENIVLFCHVARFQRHFDGTFATVKDIMKNPKLEKKINGSIAQFEASYIGAPLKLGRFLSKVINGTCDKLNQRDIFTWKQVDETLACGERTLSRNEFGTCSQNLCQSYPGTPFSRGLACNKFRSCNYMMLSCDPFLANNPDPTQNRPYCVCRRTASRDASKLECPLTENDGGECEIPKRNLLYTQAELPCLCLYKFKVIYPFIAQLGENGGVRSEDRTFLDWVYREQIITAPALRFSQCPC